MFCSCKHYQINVYLNTKVDLYIFILQLLGRNINLNKLLGQRIYTSLMKCLEVANNMFVSEDLARIMVCIESMNICYNL